MRTGEQYPIGAGGADAHAAGAPEQQSQRQPDAAGQAGHPGRPARRRAAMAVLWTAAAAGVFVLFLRVALTVGVSSDAANNALQSWDLLHGHLLLHGWLIGDATYYTFDLPVIALVELFLGLHTIAVHVSLALIYLIVAVCAVAIAVTGASSPAARLSRAGVVVAVLAAPSLLAGDRWVTLGLPDHTGTTVFLLVSCLLVDRATSRRFTAPLLCVILVAGQIGDVTVRYVTVPAVCVVAAYQMLAARKIRTGDTAILVAGIVSLPLATVVRALMRRFGSYLMVSPKTKLAPSSLWSHNADLAWRSLRELFGSQPPPRYGAPGPLAIVGSICLLVAAAGFVAALARWPRVRRADQVLVVAIVANMAVYILSTLPGTNTPHDIVDVLPAGAILAARLLVPARLGDSRALLPRLAAAGVTGAAAIAALLPLSWIAAQPSATGAANQQLADWLTAHRLSYGLGGYWNSSAVAVQSANQVQIRALKMVGGVPRPFPWETDLLWFDPARYDANFVVVQGADPAKVSVIEHVFGKPAETGTVAGREILIYHKNLLRLVKPARPKPTS